MSKPRKSRTPAIVCAPAWCTIAVETQLPDASKLKQIVAQVEVSDEK
jgi:hypothetical protein